MTNSSVKDVNRWITCTGYLFTIFRWDHNVVFSSADSCTYMQNHNGTIIKTQEDFFRKIFVPLTLFVRVRKGCSRFACKRELETEQKLQYSDPHSYDRQRCVFLVLQGCSTGGPEAHSAGWWLSLLHLISIFSGPQLIRAPMAPSAWCDFPYHISSMTPSDL